MSPVARKYVIPHNIRVVPELMLPPDAAFGVRAGFHILAGLDQCGKLQGMSVPGSTVLLFLSTCYSQEATFNACAYELDSWFARDGYNFDRVLSLLEATDWANVQERATSAECQSEQHLFGEATANADDRQRDRARVLNESRKGVRLSSLLQNCRVYLSQFREKDSLFHDQLEKVLESAEAYFSKDDHARYFWEERIKKTGLIDKSRQSKFDSRFVKMRAIERCAYSLMDVVECGLVSIGLWTARGPEAASSSQLPDMQAAVEALLVHARTVQAKAYWRDIDPDLGKLQSAIDGLSPQATDDQIRSFIDCCRSCFVSLFLCFDMHFPQYNERSALPFTPSKVTHTRDFEDRVLRNKYLLFLDLINSKLAPTQVKVWIVDALGGLAAECTHEPTGNDSYLIVTDSWEKAGLVISTLRSRVDVFEEENGFQGIRAAVAKGDCIARTRRRSGEQSVMLTDRDGTPDIPKVAYQLDAGRRLLEQSDEVLPTEERTGIVVDQEVVHDVVESLDPTALSAAGFSCLGEWTLKRVRGTAFFFRGPDPS